MGAYDCDCINNLEYDRRERKQKEQSQSTTGQLNDGARSTAQSTDLIDRQQAIDALDTAIEYYDGIAEECRKKADIERNDYMDMRDDAYEARQLAQCLNELKYLREKIEQLTIKPEPHEGHWIRTDCGLDVECKCSRCGYKDFVEPRDEYWFKRNYCPNCGAKMTISTK